MPQSNARRTLFLTPQAAKDLECIAYFIGQDSEQHAEHVTNAILQTMELLTAFPLIGRSFATQQEAMPEVRFYSVRKYPSYGIYYRCSEERLSIVRVLHASMDAPWHINP